MNLGVDLYQVQTQKLVMTMEMKQAIHILRCTVEELGQFIEEIANTNPVVEFKRPPASSGISCERRQGIPWEQVPSAGKGMIDSLLEQIRFVDAPSEIQDLASYFIGLLNESGYLQESDDDLALLCGTSITEVRLAIHLLQRLDPPGIGAQNLRDCLRLQLKHHTLQHRHLLEQIIDHHLEDVASGKISTIARALKTSHADVQEALDALKHFNPRPGLSYNDGLQTQYIVPELILRQVGETYFVMPNERSQFRVFANPRYKHLVTSIQDPEAQQYLKKHLQGAEWLYDCLEQRKQTLQRVATCIVTVQAEFFKSGPSALKPLTLREVAEQVGMHESTVSRAVRGKYIDTPRGVIELNYFFTSEISSCDGSISAETAKYWIRQCVAQEDPIHPLSDEALSKQMQHQGIQISRRTIAKYREELRIPASARRRRFA